MLFFPDRLRIYNWKKLTPLAYLDYHTDTVNAVDFSDDLPEYGQLLAAGGKDARISLWSLYKEKRQAVQWQARWWRVFSTRWSYVERWVKWGYAAFATIPSFFKAQSGACLVPRRLSLDVNLRAKGRWEGNHLSSPSLGPSRFVTSHSRFVIALLYTGFATCLKFATFEFATYILRSLPIGEVQNLLLRRGKRKRPKERVCR